MRNLAIVKWLNRLQAEPSVEETIEFIKQAHDGQYDWGGKPYWHHPIAVMMRLPPHAPKHAKLAALLHDVIEDTRWTRFGLRWRRGYRDATLDIVELLTRKEDGVSYLDKIRAIVASGNVWAMHVKRADNDHNSDPSRRLGLSPEQLKKVDGLSQRYGKSIAILEEGIRRATG